MLDHHVRSQIAGYLVCLLAVAVGWSTSSVAAGAVTAIAGIAFATSTLSRDPKTPAIGIGPEDQAALR